MDENSLTHYGVKGMRWGIRKDYSKSGKPSKAAMNVVRQNIPNPNKMSNEQLQSAINRARLIDEYDRLLTKQSDAQLASKVRSMQLDKQYRELHSTLNPTTSKKVANLVKSSAATYMAYKTIDKASNKALSKSIRSGVNILVGPFVRTGGIHAK